MKQDYTPGQGCQCNAYSEEECGCNVDWTPKEVYELREQRDRLAEILREEVAAHAKTIADLQDMEEQRDIWKAKAERWREAAEESFQTRAWKQLIEEEKNRMRSRLEYMVGEDWGSKLSKSK